jgi:hypothetical protein
MQQGRGLAHQLDRSALRRAERGVGKQRYLRVGVEPLDDAGNAAGQLGHVLRRAIHIAVGIGEEVSAPRAIFISSLIGIGRADIERAAEDEGKIRHRTLLTWLGKSDRPVQMIASGRASRGPSSGMISGVWDWRAP